jgi:hypothetical protein
VALTILTPIRPDREAELQDYFEQLSRSGQRSPLARVPGTHFARWVIVPRFHRDPAQPKDEILATKYLLFTSNADGPLTGYVDGLCSELLDEAARIWGCCIGFPSSLTASSLKAYLNHNQISTGLFLSAYPEDSVGDVQRRLGLRDRIIKFAAAAQKRGPADARRAFIEEFSP